MTVQVFVSYSRKDFRFVKSIVAFLEKQFVVWWDDDIVGGTDFTTDIFKKIDKSQVAVVVWSANAATSEWVRNESQAAVERTGVIFGPPPHPFTLNRGPDLFTLLGFGSYKVIPILLDGTPLPPISRTLMRLT
jgi:hypothetical protein